MHFIGAKPSSYILLLLQHNNCLDRMVLAYCFVIDIKKISLSGKRFINSYRVRINYLCNICKIVYFYFLYVQTMICQKLKILKLISK